MVLFVDTLLTQLHNWFKPLGAKVPPLYLVGGAVRDYLLSRPVSDIDLVCDNPERFSHVLAATRNAVVVPFLKKADAPCFRVVNREDPADHLDLSPIHGGDIITDLSRRDFTINAMAIPILPGGERGDPIDPHNGRRDLAERIVRATGPDVLSADPLRILRAVRFSAQLEFKIDEDTLQQIRSIATFLQCIAVERIWAELEKILSLPRGASYIRQMDDLGILPVIFPEIAALKGCTQNEHHHLDVWGHSLAALENCETVLSDLGQTFDETAAAIGEKLNQNSRLIPLKLAALLHDIGKPVARQMDEASGKITFYGHDERGAAITDRICTRLKLSNRTREFATLLVANHMHALFLSRQGVKEKTTLKWFRKLGDDMVSLIILSLADIRATLGPASDLDSRAQHEAWACETVSAYFSTVQKKLGEEPFVTGNDLLGMGMHRGPDVGHVLKQLREAQDHGQVQNREDALVLANELIQRVS